ncbi:MAG: hypothetical protein ACXAEU_02395, partial [Candidatus Hodarchaeales archaeon]
YNLLTKEIQLIEKRLTSQKKFTELGSNHKKTEKIRSLIDLDYFRTRLVHKLEGLSSSKPIVENMIKKAKDINYQLGLGRGNYLLAQLLLYDSEEKNRFLALKLAREAFKLLKENQIHDGMVIAKVTEARYYYELEFDLQKVNSIFREIEQILASVSSQVQKDTNLEIARSYYLYNKARTLSYFQTSRSETLKVFDEALSSAKRLKLDRYAIAVLWSKEEYLYNTGFISEMLDTALEIASYYGEEEVSDLFRLTGFKFIAHCLIGNRDLAKQVLNEAFVYMSRGINPYSYYEFFVNTLYNALIIEDQEILKILLDNYQKLDGHHHAYINVYEIACESIKNLAEENIGTTVRLSKEMFDQALEKIAIKDLLPLFNIHAFNVTSYMKVASEEKRKEMMEDLNEVISTLLSYFRSDNLKFLLGKIYLMRAGIHISRWELDTAKSTLTDAIDIFNELEIPHYQKLTKKLLVDLQNKKMMQKRSVKELEKKEFDELQKIFLEVELTRNIDDS